ncbi:MAG TPA: hypothetical protein VI758_05525 [Bacteroidota bacterium]
MVRSVILPLLLLLQLQVSRKTLPENIYPSWFFEPPAGRIIATVGYSDEHAYVDSAIKAAIREAAWNYVKNERVRIAGAQGLATLAAGTITVGSTIKEYVDVDEAGKLTPAMKALDYFQRGGSVTVLASTDSMIPFQSLKRIDATKVPKPGWTTMIPDNTGFIYNVGLAPLYYNENNSWREAERKARINIALTLYTKVKFLGKKSDNTYFREFQVEETNVTLRRTEIVARWKDVKNQICYVLMRMPVGS